MNGFINNEDVDWISYEYLHNYPACRQKNYQIAITAAFWTNLTNVVCSSKLHTRKLELQFTIKGLSTCYFSTQISNNGEKLNNGFFN